MFNWLYKKIAKFVSVPAPVIDINNEEIKNAIQAMIAKNLPSKDEIFAYVVNCDDFFPSEQDVRDGIVDRYAMPDSDDIKDAIASNCGDLPSFEEIKEAVVERVYNDLPDTDSFKDDIKEAIVNQYDEIEITSDDVLTHLVNNDYDFKIPRVTSKEILKQIDVEVDLPEKDELIEAVINQMNQNGTISRLNDAVLDIVVEKMQTLIAKILRKGLENYSE